MITNKITNKIFRPFVFNGDDCFKTIHAVWEPTYKKKTLNYNMLSHLRIKSSIFILLLTYCIPINYLFQLFNIILVIISKQFYLTYGQIIMSFKIIFFYKKKTLNLRNGRCWQYNWSLHWLFVKSTTMCRLGPKYSETVSNVTALSEIPWPSNKLGGNSLAPVWSSTAQTPEVTIWSHKV